MQREAEPVEEDDHADLEQEISDILKAIWPKSQPPKTTAEIIAFPRV